MMNWDYYPLADIYTPENEVIWEEDIALINAVTAEIHRLNPSAKVGVSQASFKGFCEYLAEHSQGLSWIGFHKYDSGHPDFPWEYKDDKELFTIASSGVGYDYELNILWTPDEAMQFFANNGKYVEFWITETNLAFVYNPWDPRCQEPIVVSWFAEQTRDLILRDNANDKQGKTDGDGLVKDQVITLSRIGKDEDEIRDLENAFKNSYNQRAIDHRTFMTKYLDAPNEIKKQVRNGTIDIADIEEEIYKQLLKEKAEERPKTIFIPNFAQRMKDFDKNVAKLEKQISIFSKVFHSVQFKERYNILKPKQKKDLNFVIFDIRERIQKCQDEIDFFMKQLPENVIMLEAKQ